MTRATHVARGPAKPAGEWVSGLGVAGTRHTRHTAYIGSMSDLERRLHAAGKRLTTQRSRVLEVIRALGHATPDEVVAALAAEGHPLPASTVYRSLNALSGLGLLTHTHVDQRVPSYHLADHGRHIHLYCRGCGSVGEAEVAVAAELVDRLAADHGFAADVTHSAIHGLCSTCRSEKR